MHTTNGFEERYEYVKDIIIGQNEIDIMKFVLHYAMRQNQENPVLPSLAELAAIEEIKLRQCRPSDGIPQA